MKLSFVIELLLIFLLIAFAASRVIDSRDAKGLKNQQKQDEAPNRYCSCSTDSCDCCREFSLPVIPIKGPGCASLQYIKGDNMALTLKFGDRVLATHSISGKRPKPVCMRLPGGYSRFCARVYGISREPDAFHACLGLEIRALDDLEAALRLSCFRFSPEGLRLEPAKPVPVDEDDDDEDDDDYGFGDEDDDDDSDEEDEDDEEEEDEGALGGGSEDEEEDDEIAAGVGDENEISADYAGFSILGDLLGLDDESAEVPVKKKPNRKTASTPAPVPVVTPTQTPHKVIVQVHHIHNSAATEAAEDAPAPVVTNNKVMDKVQDQTTAAAPTKAPAKPSPQKVPTRAPTKAPPTRAPTKAPSKPATKPPSKGTSQAATEQPLPVTVMTFSPITSSDYSVNVVQDGQALQTVDDLRIPEGVAQQENPIKIPNMSEGVALSDEADEVVKDPVDDEDDDDDDDDEEEDDEEEEEEKEEEEKDEEEGSGEDGAEKPQKGEDEDDDEYEDDEEEDEDGEKDEDAVTSTTENPTTTGAEKRWRRRKNRLDHIFWQ
ncbi:ABC transporter F family member 4-like [Hetaerina americana]|uniref:ABC transporter F family member 4-like n=1 Tax=Hetaerina americana TaxID=62018 RepID=UPI003A7F3CB8